MTKIENLNEITISFQAGTRPDTMDSPVKYPEFKFIFGLGLEGMTPFEYELVDKSEGENVLILLKKEQFCRFFEHLNPPLKDLFAENDEVFLRVDIVSVAPAEHREIVKSMAAIAAHGESAGGCGCGCGC